MRILQYLIVLFIFTQIHLLTAQKKIVDSFNENFINEFWIGDRMDFEIDKQQLHLNKINPESKNSTTLYTPIAIGSESSWSFYSFQDFNPSSSNFITISLLSADASLTLDGLYLQLGGISGNTDPLIVYERTKGVKTILFESSMSEFATKPQNNLKVIKKDTSYSIEIKTAENPFVKLGSFNYLTHFTTGFFGFKLAYTKTRANKIYLDDILLDNLKEDTEPPKFLNYEFIDNQYHLFFDEPILNAEVFLANEQIEATIIQNEIILNSTFPLGELVLEIFNLNDIFDNVGDTAIQIGTPLPYEPNYLEVVFSEIHYEPENEQSEFVELYNSSDSSIELEYLKILNIKTAKIDTFTLPSKELKPKQFYVLSKNISPYLNYPNVLVSNLIETKIPNLNNTGGTLELIYESPQKTIKQLDRASFSSDFHNYWLKEQKGVSLKRIDLTKEATNSNWSSGNTNESFLSPTFHFKNLPSRNEVISFSKNYIYTNQEEYENLSIFVEPTHLESKLTITIFNQFGSQLFQLVNSHILDCATIYEWDGKINQQLLPAGNYILYVEIISTSGKNIKFKKNISILHDN